MPQYAHSNDNNRLGQPPPQVERTFHQWIGTLELQVTDTTHDEKEVRVQVMAITSFARAHLPLMELLSIERLTLLVWKRMAAT